MITEERISKLTSAVYKVTDLFADKEPLKFAIRRGCLDVLSSCISLMENTSPEAKKQAAKKGEIQSKTLLKYLSLAEYQTWINPKNFSILKNEYSEVNYWFSDQLLRIQKSLESRVKRTQSEPFRQSNNHVIASSEKHLQEGYSTPHDSSIFADERALSSIESEESISRLSDPAPLIRVSSNTYESRVESVEMPLATTNLVNNDILHNSLKTETLELKNPSRGVESSPSVELSAELINQVSAEIKAPGVLYNIGATINYEELTSNQLKILELLQNKKFLKSTQVCDYFQDISERTIRREIKELKDKSIIIAKGSGKSTSYQLNYIY